MAVKTTGFFFSSLKDCLIFLNWLHERGGKQKLGDVVKNIQERLRQCYKTPDESKMKSSLSTFLASVDTFYKKLIPDKYSDKLFVGANSVPRDPEKSSPEQIVDAFLECLPKFLAAMYYLWYNVDAAFNKLGGGEWQDNHPGIDGRFYVWQWARSGDWGGATQRYLRATTQSPEFGLNSGVIPGGFDANDLKEGWNYSSHEGYYYAKYMIPDIEAILRKNEHNYFRDVFVTSVIADKLGAETVNVANALALVGRFCEIVGEEADKESGGTLKEKLDEILKSESPKKCICWKDLKEHCSKLGSQLGKIFKVDAFSFTGYGREYKDLMPNEFAKDTANWLRNHLLRVKEKMKRIEEVGSRLSASQNKNLAEYLTKNFFPYGFTFYSSRYYNNNVPYEVLKTDWDSVITMLRKDGDDGGLQKLKTILEGYKCGANPVVTKAEAAKPTATKTEATKTEAAKPVVTKAEAAKPTATETEATKTTATPPQGGKAEGTPNQAKKVDSGQGQTKGQSEGKPSSSSSAAAPQTPSSTAKQAPAPAGTKGEKRLQGSPVQATTSPTKNPVQQQSNQSPPQPAPHPQATPPKTPAAPGSTSQSGGGGGSKNGGGGAGKKAGVSSQPGQSQSPSVKASGPGSPGVTSTGGGKDPPAAGPPGGQGQGKVTQGGVNTGKQPVDSSQNVITQLTSAKSTDPQSPVVPAPSNGLGPGVQGSTSSTTQLSDQGTSQSSTNAATTASTGLGGGGGGSGSAGDPNHQPCAGDTSSMSFGNSTICVAKSETSNRRSLSVDLFDKLSDIVPQYGYTEPPAKNRPVTKSTIFTHPSQPSRPAPGPFPPPPGGHVSHGLPFYDLRGRDREQGAQKIVYLRGEPVPDEPLPDQYREEKAYEVEKQRNSRKWRVEQNRFLDTIQKQMMKDAEDEKRRQIEDMERFLRNDTRNNDAGPMPFFGAPINHPPGSLPMMYSPKEVPYVIGNEVRSNTQDDNEQLLDQNAKTAYEELYANQKRNGEERYNIHRSLQTVSNNVNRFQKELVMAIDEDVRRIKTFNDSKFNISFPSPPPYYDAKPESAEVKFFIDSVPPRDHLKYRHDTDQDHSNPSPSYVSLEISKPPDRFQPSVIEMDPFMDSSNVEISQPSRTDNLDPTADGIYGKDEYDVDHQIQVPDRTLQDSSYDIDIEEPSPLLNLQPLDPIDPSTTAISVNFPPIDPPESLPNRYVDPYTHDAQSVGMCIAPWMKQTEIGDSTDIPETELFPTQAPRTVRDMLQWLAGLRNQKHHETLKQCINKAFGGPHKDPSQLALFINHTKVRPNDVFDILQLNAMFAGSVLTAIAPRWRANVSSRFVKPNSSTQSDEPDCCALLCQLRDYVYACHHQLQFLKAQCNRGVKHGGWQDCTYGSDLKTSSPLQAFLTDGWDSDFDTHLFDPCNLCLKSRIRMGFRKEDLPEKSQLGSVISTILSPSCGGSDPLLTLASYLNCLTRRTPRTTGELVSFFAHFGSELHNFAFDSLSQLGSSLTNPHDHCPGWDHLGRHDLQAVKGIRGTESLNSKHNSSHDNDHPRTLSTLVGCSSDSSNCLSRMSPITYRAYALYSHAFAHTYLSWTVYLPDRLWESLEKLYNDLKKHDYAKCTSLYSCTKAMPLLYLHGFTPPEVGSQLTVKCSDVMVKLKEIANGGPIASLMTAMDNFLYGIREPFIYTVVALWSLAFLIFANTMLYRIDILHIRSHLIRTKASHVIDVKALLSDNKKMLSLYDASYFDDDPNELLNLR